MPIRLVRHPKKIKMKSIYLTIILLLSGTILKAQILNQDAKGESTIITTGSTIGVSIPDGLIKMNYYTTPIDPDGNLWGIDLQGKSQNGVAELFSTDDFIPNTKISGLFALRDSDYIESRKSKQVTEWMEKSLQLTMTALGRYDDLLSKHISSCNGIIDEKTAQLKEVIIDLQTHDLYSEILKIRDTAEVKGYSAFVGCIDNLTDAIKEEQIFKDWKKNEDKISKLREDDNLKDKVRTGMFYIRPGLEALSFKRDLGAANQTIANRFVTQKQNLGFLEIGLSGSINRLFLGTSVKWRRTDNFSKLTKNEFDFTKESNLDDGVLKQSTKITAYSGEYNAFWSTDLSSDLIYLIPISETYSFGLGSYLRWTFPEDDTNLSNSFSWGVNGSFINGVKGSFLGGFYIQYNKETDKTRKDEITDNRISFGLTTRFSFQSIFPK